MWVRKCDLDAQADALSPIPLQIASNEEFIPPAPTPQQNEVAARLDLLSEEGAKELLALVPHAEYADVAGAGHMVAGDRNDLFNDAIVDFLDRVRG